MNKRLALGVGALRLAANALAGQGNLRLRALEAMSSGTDSGGTR